MEIRSLSAEELSLQAHDLGKVLRDCVEGGASVHFMTLAQSEATAFYEDLVPQVQRNERIVLAAFLDQKPVGSVQVVLASPPNQRHRGEIAKLVVHRSARNQGIALALMGRAEEEAIKAGKWLLMLDTVTGDAAEKLYTRLGWNQVGVIPNYAYRPDGTLSGSTYFYKDLRP